MSSTRGHNTPVTTKRLTIYDGKASASATKTADSKESSEEKALDEGPLEALFTGNANAKILDFVTVFRDWDYSESDIAKNAGVNVRTVQRSIAFLEQIGLVKQVRVVGRAKMYKLDRESETGKSLDKLARAIASRRIHSALEKVKEEDPKDRLISESGVN